MAEAGDAAKKWISCEIKLWNDDLYKWEQYGYGGSITCPPPIQVLAELDTGCKHLALLPEQIRALQLEQVNKPVSIKSALHNEPKMIKLYGPVRVEFCQQIISVLAYEMEHAPHALLGLEPAQRLGVEVDWEACKVILPSTSYIHNAFTIGPEDLSTLFGSNSKTIIGLQNEYCVSIEISNRKKVDKIVVLICTGKDHDSVAKAAAAVKKICPTLTPAPEE